MEIAPSKDPEKTYTIPGYSEIIYEVIGKLDLKSYAIIRYSLGGNIALQFSQIPKNRAKGIMIVSCAPMKYSEEALLAYPPYEGGFAAYPRQLTEQQAKQYLGACGFHVNDPEVYFMIEDAMKTDGKSREKMVASVLGGYGMDETQIVSQLTCPLAIVAGSDDTAIVHDYISQLKYRNLWCGAVQ